MPTVLITGASRGLGLEFARQYAADGWRVVATCRDPSGSGKTLETIEGTVEIHALDVTDHGRVEALAEELAKESIDLLLNVAGIYGPRPLNLDNVDYAAWEEVFRVNAMAPLKVGTSFVAHVARSDLKRMVTISSVMGSIERTDSGGAYIYRSSKAAVNSVMKILSADLKARGVTVVVFHPGWVRTDMGGPGAAIDAEESVTGMRRVIARLKPKNNGAFFNYNGARIPW